MPPEIARCPLSGEVLSPVENYDCSYSTPMRLQWEFPEKVGMNGVRGRGDREEIRNKRDAGPLQPLLRTPTQELTGYQPRVLGKATRRALKTTRCLSLVPRS